MVILRRLVLGATAVLGCLTLAGCAVSSPAAPTRTGYHGLPLGRAAEPGSAPPVTVPPVGRVVDLPAGTHPWGVVAAPAAGEVYLAARKQDRLIAVDLWSFAVRTRPAPGSARMMDLAAPDGPLLLPGEDTNTVYRLDLPSLRVVGSARTHPHPHQAVQVDDTTYVSEETARAVAVIRGDRVVARLPGPDSPGGITAVPGRVAAVDVHANRLFVWDESTHRLLAALPAGKGPSHVVPVGGSRVAVCDVRGHAVLTYDLAGTPRALGRAAVPGRAFWVEADVATGTVYAALSDANRVAQLRVGADGRPRLVATVPTVRQPISMDLDAASGTLYVGGYADSQLQVVPVNAFDGPHAHRSAGERG